MKKRKGSPRSRWAEVDPNDPALNPGYLSTMTWNPDAAVQKAEKALKTPFMRSLAQFISKSCLLNAAGNPEDNLKRFLRQKTGEPVGLRTHPLSFLFRNGQIHGLVTLDDGQQVFLSYYHGTPPPLKAILQSDCGIEGTKPLTVQVSPVDLENLRIYLERIGPEFAPVTPSGPGVGLGNRMGILDYPMAYEVVERYGSCVAAIQSSVFREMVPEKAFHRDRPPSIELPGVGLIPAGHIGCSVEGQFVAGMIYRIQNGMHLPTVADADHIPIKGASKQALGDIRTFIEAGQDRTLFTLDPHFCIYGGDPTVESNAELLEKVFKSLPPERQAEILTRYADKEFRVDYVSGDGSFSIHMTRDEVVEAAVRFEEPVKAIAETWYMITEVKAGKPYAVEVSIDEAPGMTEPHHLLYLAMELASRGLKPFSLAPGLGFTKRDLDVEGPHGFFEERVRQLASIAHKFGAVTGIHSGDGKGFATRRILARATGGRFWYKIAPDRQRTLFKALSRFPRGSYERALYEDIFDWTLCWVVRLSLEAEGETARSAKEAMQEILEQETATARRLRTKLDETSKRLREGEEIESAMADVEKTIRSPTSNLVRDTDSRIIHDYAFAYVGNRDKEARFFHRGRFFAISDEAVEAYKDEDRAYLRKMFEALELIE